MTAFNAKVSILQILSLVFASMASDLEKKNIFFTCMDL